MAEDEPLLQRALGSKGVGLLEDGVGMSSATAAGAKRSQEAAAAAAQATTSIVVMKYPIKPRKTITGEEAEIELIPDTW